MFHHKPNIDRGFPLNFNMVSTMLHIQTNNHGKGHSINQIGMIISKLNCGVLIGSSKSQKNMIDKTANKTAEKLVFKTTKYLLTTFTLANHFLSNKQLTLTKKYFNCTKLLFEAIIHGRDYKKCN